MIEFTVGVRLSDGRVVPLSSRPIHRPWAETQVSTMNALERSDRYCLLWHDYDPWKVWDGNDELPDAEQEGVQDHRSGEGAHVGPVEEEPVEA